MEIGWFCSAASHTIKSNLHHTCAITPKRVTSSGAHLRGLAPEKRFSGDKPLAALHPI